MWQDPKTDWTAGDTVTAADMVRIGGNINYLLNRHEVKDNWTTSDYVFLTDWRAIITACSEIAVKLDIGVDDITEDVTSSNFNIVESFLLEAYNYIETAERQARYYAGEIYTDEQYSGGYIYGV